MNIYSAILKAADTIEQHPELWDWSTCIVPSQCGTPGCALGWIGFHLGMSGQTIQDLNAKLGIDGNSEFYNRMRTINQTHQRDLYWRGSPALIVVNLRLYAEKYHAPEKPAITGIPESVRQIFTTVQA